MNSGKYEDFTRELALKIFSPHVLINSTFNIEKTTTQLSDRSPKKGLDIDKLNKMTSE